MNLITLTTDFGVHDWFVGAMKGVILSRCPEARIVDLTHDIPPGDVRAAAFALWAACDYFPKGTVHVAVVDPGVGSERPAIAARTDRFFFVGPDNGILSAALGTQRLRGLWRLEDRSLFLEPVSATFHGRDVFAPVAAYLCGGGDPAKLGPRGRLTVQLPWPEARKTAAGWEGEVLYLDRFGNAITNLPAPPLPGPPSTRRGPLSSKPAFVRLPNRRRCPVAPFYQAVKAGAPLAVVGATGFLEIAVNGGNAARVFGLKVGSKVSLWLRS